MPHLQFEFNRPIPADVKTALSESVMRLFADVMDTGTDHIGITLREYETHALALGRARDPQEGIAFVSADIRAGRTLDQRRTLALGIMERIHSLCAVPRANVYMVFTEHAGEDFHLHERVLASWQAGEDPLAASP